MRNVNVDQTFNQTYQYFLGRYRRWRLIAFVTSISAIILSVLRVVHGAPHAIYIIGG